MPLVSNQVRVVFEVEEMGKGGRIQVSMTWMSRSQEVLFNQTIELERSEAISLRGALKRALNL